jgi:hypothetical protein
MMQRFLSFGYLATIVGGVALASGALVQILGSQGQPFSAQVVTASFIVAAALRLIGATGILIGVTAIYARQSDPAGAFGLVAYVLVVAGMVIHLGTISSDLFVTGAFASRAPGILDGSISDSRLSAMFLASWLLTTTLALLGIATLRAGVYRRAVGWLLITAGVITLIPLDGVMTEVLYATALAVTGLLARRSTPTTPSAGAPVEAAALQGRKAG